MNQSNLFENARMKLPEAMELTINSLKAYGAKYRHWTCAFSGGKDSTATVTMVAYLIEQGLIPEPESLAVLYADTRQELPPLHFSAMQILSELSERGIKTQVVLPPMDKRYFVYMLGRGVPPPNNNTLRWCTRQIKIDPMIAALRSLRDSIGEKFLMLTGVRLGESAARDQRIATSCSRDGGECGQGWFQQSTPESVADTLAPLLHWRVCHVWAWLASQAPALGFSTRQVALVYGGDEAEELNARTGCIGCPLATKDQALDSILKLIDWVYLAPLKRLRPLYRELREAKNRLRQPGSETRKDGTLASNPQRLGPLTLEAREYALETILGVQNEINISAQEQGRPLIDLINDEEESRIRELIAAKTFPQKWTGDEPDGLVMLDKVMRDGTIQPLLMTME
jgi:DNA sulfur modification protein DndC